ncbi:MAG: glycosyltransferase family 4 protein [Polyangiales bacterium]
MSPRIQHHYRDEAGDAEPWPADRPLLTCVVDPGDVALRDDLAAQTFQGFEVRSPGDPAGAGRYRCVLPPGTRLTPHALEVALFHAESYGLARHALTRHRSTTGALCTAPSGQRVTLVRGGTTRAGYHPDGARNLGAVRGALRDGAPTVLAVVPYLFPGGAERLLHAVARHLTGEGWRLLVVVTLPPRPECGDASPWFRDVTLEVLHLGLLLPEQSWGAFVRHLVASRGVRVVWQMGSRWLYPQLPALRAAFPDLAVVDQLFNPAVHLAEHRRHRGSISAALCENDETRRALEASAGPPLPVTMIQSGVDLTRLAPAPARPAQYPDGAPRGAFVMGFFGRLSDEKNPLFAVALARALADDEGVEVIVAGAGAREKALRRAHLQAARETPSLGRRVRVVGLLEDPVPWMRCCDVVLLPSLVDGRPNTVLEALALGVPVLATRVGALPDLVASGERGAVFDGCDVAAWAAVVRRLRAEPETLRAWSLAARAHAVSQLDVRRANAEYARFFDALVGRASPVR